MDHHEWINTHEWVIKVIKGLRHFKNLEWNMGWNRINEIRIKTGIPPKLIRVSIVS